jgi:hypothetical protein
MRRTGQGDKQHPRWGWRLSADWEIHPKEQRPFMEERPMRKYPPEITVGTETHTVHITTYTDGTHNTAIQTYDSEGIPYCRLTTNPGYPLEEGVIVLRDDYEGVIGDTRAALVKAGVIEMLQPQRHIRIGYTTGTLYRVIG